MQEFTDQMPADIRRYPMVPIRDVVIFPFTKVAFKIGRPSSVRALEEAMNGERDIFLATQHDATIDEPSAEQIYTTGTLGRILQAQRQENGQIKVVVEGRERGQRLIVGGRVKQNATLGEASGEMQAIWWQDGELHRYDNLTDMLEQYVDRLVFMIDRKRGRAS